MGTFGAQRLRRQSISSKRTRQSVKAIETYLGQSIGGNTCYNKASKETSSKQRLGDHNERSLDQTNKR